MLCSETNRVSLPGSPSMCALDTSITLIPSFLLLAFLAVYVPTRFFLSQRGKTSTSGISSTPKPSYDTYSYSSPSESPQRSFSAGFPKWCHWTYVGLVGCLLALRVLEVVRLALANMGVGLLPVAIIATIINLVMLTCGGSGCETGKTRSLTMSATLVVYWALSTVAESVKVARLVTYNSVHSAKGTAYPSSDYLLDNACMLGLLVLFLVIEGTYLVLRWRSSFVPIPELVLEKTISKPRPMSEYDPVVYFDRHSSGPVV